MWHVFQGVCVCGDSQEVCVWLQRVGMGLTKGGKKKTCGDIRCGEQHIVLVLALFNLVSLRGTRRRFISVRCKRKQVSPDRRALQHWHARLRGRSHSFSEGRSEELQTFCLKFKHTAGERWWWTWATRSSGRTSSCNQRLLVMPRAAFRQLCHFQRLNKSDFFSLMFRGNCKTSPPSCFPLSRS